MKSDQIKEYGSSKVVEINESAPTPNVSTGKILVIVNPAGLKSVD